MQIKKLSFTDRLIEQLDSGIKTLTTGANQASRETPANSEPHYHYEASEQQHIAGLMRINHTGEVCAQALYQGQALTAKQAQTREAMQHAADEEIDHLVWCEQRLKELNSSPSILNPIFYGLSFTLGAVTGAISDKISLGFIEATEDQVCKHLQSHLEMVPKEDRKTCEILQTMLQDEQAHGQMALEQGGALFPQSIKKTMAAISKVMTSTTYRI